MPGPRFIGIDLGTTNSCVATLGIGGRPEIIASAQGERTMPSVVGFTRQPDGSVKTVVGSPARRQAVTNPRSTVVAAKRLIGRRADDPEVRAFAGALPYPVVAAPNGDAMIEVAGQRLSPQEVSAHVLAALHDVAEAHFGEALDDAIITVPAYFDHAQRQATKDAAEIAGIKVRRLLNEPTAAALGYGAHRQPAARFAVCDLGGGTFDVSIVNVEQGVFEVISTTGDNFLGGEDFDRRVVTRLAGEIRAAYGLDVEAEPTTLQRLREEVEKLKHALSEVETATLQLPYLGKHNYLRVMRRGELETWTRDLVDRLERPCHEALGNAGLQPADVDQVILVGGATRMPAVQRKIEHIFRRPPARTVNPDEVVAIGAATQCALLAGLLEGVVLLDVTSRTLGFHAGGGRFVPVIPRNATIPTRDHKIIATQKDDQTEIVIEVFEGEHVDVARNRPLGKFVLGGLPQAPAGDVLVMVDFTVDVDGILLVSARELSSGVRTDVRVVATCGLTRRDVRRLAEERARPRERGRGRGREGEGRRS
jgi:molecular chaperone DnaK